ncbi:hypothetical protein AltI4_39110 [Alteromonas sp. I4]|nr:hypothetical protein AltI4_39110 [Alteromonas sp. I4]
MKPREEADDNLRRVMINLVVIAVFTILMETAIVYMYDAEPDIEAELMDGYARQFAGSATNAHWQWQAEGRPEMIMLVHYDGNGKEVGRRPVRMAHFGWPKVEPNSEGCTRVWEQLLNMPARVEGFRVLGEYYASDNDDAKVPNARCRFRVSTGPFFDYSIYTGVVTRGE